MRGEVAGTPERPMCLFRAHLHSAADKDQRIREHIARAPLRESEGGKGPKPQRAKVRGSACLLLKAVGAGNGGHPRATDVPLSRSLPATRRSQPDAQPSARSAALMQPKPKGKEGLNL